MWYSIQYNGIPLRDIKIKIWQNYQKEEQVFAMAMQDKGEQVAQEHKQSVNEDIID